MATTIVLQSVPSSHAMRQVRRGLAKGQLSGPCLIRVQMKDGSPGKTMGLVPPHVPPLGEKTGCGGTHTTGKMHLLSGQPLEGRQQEAVHGRHPSSNPSWTTDNLHKHKL